MEDLKNCSSVADVRATASKYLEVKNTVADTDLSTVRSADTDLSTVRSADTDLSTVRSADTDLSTVRSADTERLMFTLARVTQMWNSIWLFLMT